jgi:hypothetical protein
MTRPLNLAFLNRDRGYRWRDRDPVIEEICAIITASGKSTKEISEMTAKASNGIHKVSATTMSRWLDGTTRKPTNYCVTWVGYVLGWRRGWHQIGGRIQ